MAEKEEKENPKKRKIPWWVIILALIGAYYFFFVAGEVADYQYCVSDCKFNVDMCIMDSESIQDKYSTFYYNEDDIDSCIDELDSCLNHCESDYG